MKHRYKFILIASMLIVITIFLLYIFNSVPHLDANEISSIQQFRMPSPPEIITIYDKVTINQFVEYFNALDFTPLLLFRLPSGGWFARNVIEFKDKGMKYNIMFLEVADDSMLVKINHRYYKISLISYGELIDIISNKNK